MGKISKFRQRSTVIKSVKTTSAKNISEDWKNDFLNLTKSIELFNSLQHIEFTLPFAIRYNIIHNQVPPKVPIYQDYRFEKINQIYSGYYYFMKLYYRAFTNKTHFGLKLTFRAEMITTNIHKKPSYHYRWDNKHITIRKHLGTYNIEEIEKQAQMLLIEVQRFYLLYCKN